MAFTAGSMPVYMFLHPGTTEGNIEHVVRTVNQLDPKQRPKLRFVAGPPDVVVAAQEALAVAFPMDGLEHLPHIVDPEVHYELLSKRGLAVSGLRTPRATLLDLDVEQARWHFRHTPRAVFVAANLDAQQQLDNGMTRRSLIASELGEVPADSVDLGEYIRQQPLPFVVKLQQSVSGAGTWLVTTTQEQERAAHDIPLIEKHYIAKVPREAAHLKAATLIFTEYISDVVETLPLVMFVQHGGEPV